MLNSLATLSLEKKLLTETTDFNQRLTDKSANLKEGQLKFLFKLVRSSCTKQVQPALTL